MVLGKNGPRVAILGAGISGLSSAYYLQKAMGKCSIKIFEASSTTSGAIKTLPNEFLFEEGPRSIRNSNTVFEVLKICEDINILDKIVPSVSFDNVYVYYDGQLRTLPRKLSVSQISRFIKDHPKLVKGAFDISLAKKKYAEEDRNMEEFLKQKLRLGFLEFSGLSKFINMYLLNSFAKGVYRAEASNLSADLCLKKNYLKNVVHDYIDAQEFKKPTYSQNLQEFYTKTLDKRGSFNFTEGTQTFPNELAKYLQEKTLTTIALNSEVDSLNFGKKIMVNSQGSSEEFDYVISTLNSPQLSKILTTSSSVQNNSFERIKKLKNDLDSITQLPMISMNIGYNEDVIPEKLKSFGYLIPTIANQNLIGVVFDSCSFPDKQNPSRTTISLMFGDKLNPNMSNEEIIKIGLDELKEQTGITANPDKVNLKRWPPSFTEYSVNHYYKAERMINCASAIHSGFQLHGKYLFTSAIPELVLLSKSFATKLSKLESAANR